MTDSKKNNDLDKYGVWVKKPPRTIDSENEEPISDNTDDFSISDITSDFPDFSSLDSPDTVSTEETKSAFEEGDTALSPEELSGITGSVDVVKEESPVEQTDTSLEITDTPKQEENMDKDTNTSNTEEIPLDEFITGGFSDEPQDTKSDSSAISENDAPAADVVPEVEEIGTEEKSEQPKTEGISQQEESVSLDDFLDAEPEQTSAPVAPVSAESEDAPLDIDLSFDEPSADAGSDIIEDAPVEDAPAALEAAPEESKNDSSSNNETIDLSEFDFDPDSSSDSGNSDIPASSDNKTEEVDLSEFGITNDEEPTPAVSSPAASAKVDYDMSVVTEDNKEAPTEKPATPDSESGVKPEPSFTTAEDNDFDLDAIMNDVKDENGKTVCIGKAEDSLVKEVDSIPEEEIQDKNITPEKIEDLHEEAPDNSATTVAADIPDTFDEETSSLIDVPDSSDTSDSTEEQAKSSSEADTTPAQSSLLNQIVGELDSLKNEIAGLKTDFENLKKREETETTKPGVTQNEENGFFSNVGEDDTISLSGDELDNILNNADFTEPASTSHVAEKVSTKPESQSEPEPAEELPEEITSDEKSAADTENDNLFGDVDSSIDIPDQDFDTSDKLKMDFSNDNLEEPSLDDIDMSISQDNNNDSANKNIPDEISVPKDDILVDSSSTDLIDDEAAPAEELDTPSTNDVDKLYAPDPSISDTLTDDKLNYLSADDKQKMESNASEPESLEELPDEDTDVAATAKDDGTSPAIPGDLKQEIKSVLSYMDQLLENLPEDKITEFAQSEQFDTYKKLFKELGLS